MSVRTAAPHWSLWLVDEILPGHSFPEQSPDPRVAWEAGWALHELDNTRRRTTIDGSLDLAWAASESGGHELRVVQQVPLYWSMSVETTATVRSEDDMTLTPREWELTSVSRNREGPFEETRSSSTGRADKRSFVHNGASSTADPLPKKVPVASSWGLLGTLPRLVASGGDRLDLTVLEELYVVRPKQQLQRRGQIEVSTAKGPLSLVHWRLIGHGRAPVQYFCTEQGWPLVVCGVRSALVCAYLNPGGSQ